MSDDPPKRARVIAEHDGVTETEVPTFELVSHPVIRRDPLTDEWNVRDIKPLLDEGMSHEEAIATIRGRGRLRFLDVVEEEGQEV